SGEIQLKFGLLALGLLVGLPGVARADVKFSFTTIDVPVCGPTNNGPCQTRVNGNSTNAIVGDFDDNGGNTHGFVLRGGEYTQIDVPGATSTSLNGINASGWLAGTYVDAGQMHAFFFDSGRFTTLDPPVKPLVRSQSGFLNAQGQVVGAYRTSSGQPLHG